MIAFFERFEIVLTKRHAAIGCHQGECDDDINYLLQLPEISRQFKKLSPDDIRAELKEYGAWNEDELSNNQDNQKRILWIACGNVIDQVRN